MRYMLDTNICIYAIKNKPEQVLEYIHKNMSRGLCISTITLAELEYGINASKYPEKNTIALIQFLSIMDVLNFDDHAASEYGKICANLRSKGTPIGVMDMLIAAHAKSKSLTLVTNNTKEFERVEKLNLENWTQ